MNSMFRVPVKTVFWGIVMLAVNGMMGWEWDKITLPQTGADQGGEHHVQPARSKAFIQECDSETLEQINQALPSGHVISKLTSCPKSDAWLSRYLQEYPTTNDDDDKFIFLNFGCNKGYDAIKVARQVSHDNVIFNKVKWHDNLGIRHEGACLQAMIDPKVDRPPPQQSKSPRMAATRPVEVHCVEAMPVIFKHLQTAAKTTGAAENGLHIHNYAIVGDNNSAGEATTSILFPNPTDDDMLGREFFSMADCDENNNNNNPQFASQCQEVPAITIDQFVAQHVDVGDRRRKTRRIPFLAIDVEGYDLTLLRAAPTTLQRTDYLEFEFHDKNDWSQQRLEDATTMLEQQFGMTCYWAGIDQLWRITQCWTTVYGSFHAWSNVACVNAHHQPQLAAQMERVFRETLSNTKNAATQSTG